MGAFDDLIPGSSSSSGQGFFDDLIPKKPRDRTVGEALKDTGAQLVEGAYNIAGAVPDLVAPDSRVAEFFREGAQTWRNRQSDPLLQRLAGAEEAIRRAGEDGVMSQVREAVSQYADDPALAARFVVTNLPSMIPGLVAAKGAAAASAARGASALGAISVGTTASGVTNAVLNAGGARGEAFEDIRDTLIRQGMSREEATDRALTGSLPSAAVGGVTGFVSGKTGLERSLLGPGTASSVLRRGVSSALTELGGEQLEEVTPKITTNLMAGRYDNRPATQDVGRTIVETAIGSAPGAVVSGASEGFDARLLAPRALSDRQPQTEPTPVIDDRPMIERQPPADPGMAAPIQPPQTAPATAPETNPQARFAELDLLSMSRDLTLAEQAERDALAVQLEGDDDVGANPGVSPVDPGTPGGGRAVDPAGMDARGGTGPVPADGLEPGQSAGGAPDVPVSPGPRGPDGAVTPPDPVVDAAAERLKTPVRLTALDEVDAIDSELATLSAQPPAPESQARIDELSRNREAIVSTWPTAIRGTPTEFATEAGPRVAANYAIIDADNLVTSHDIDLRENPLYPKALQPRDRSRMASQAQVAKIANALDPTRLGLSADAASGAPIVGADGLVESGNARTIALKQVYRANGQKAADYRTWLAQTADQFGLTPQQVESMRQPVLVRVRTTPVNRAEFARQANASTVARMSASEQALSDAQRITSLDALNPTDDGDIGGSTDFIREFMALLPITEQADMIETDGKLSTTGYRRIESAILAKAYGDSPVLRRMTESRDDNLRNVSKALVRVAPLIASARDRMQAGALYDADLVPDLVSAVEGLSSIKDRGWTLESELSQGDLTGPKYSPEAAQMMRLIADNVRSPRRIADYLRAFYESLEAAGDPKQGSIFGDAGPAPTVGSLLNEAQRRIDDARRAEEVAAGRGGDREGAQPDAQGGQRPQDQGGGAPSTAEDRGMAGTDGQPAVVQPATAAPAAQAGAAVAPAPVGRDAKLPLGSTLYDGQGNPWRVQNRRNGILTLQPIVNGTPDTKAARTFVIDPEKAPANTQASRDPLYLQAPNTSAVATAQKEADAPQREPMAGQGAQAQGSQAGGAPAGTETAQAGAPTEGEQGFLTAPTPQSLAQAEALRQQQSADQARRDAAPPPDDFVLSGSNSAADQARARGQMELGAEPPAQTAAPAAPVSRTPQEVVDAYRREFGATPSGMTPAQYRDFIDRRNAAEERAAQDLVEIAKRDGVQLPSGRNSGSIMLSPEPGNGGKTWRVTRFLADGTPSGHMEYNTALEAAKAALAEARGPSDLSDRPGQAERGIGRDGRTEADRYSARLAAAAEDLSGQALSETEDGEFDGLADALASFAKDGEVDAGELRQEVLKRIDASDAPEAQKAGIRTALDPTRGAPDTEQRQPITPDDAANMRAGDVITDEQGREFRAHRARGELLDAHPIVNGRAMVSADTTIRFHLNPETASAYPERRSSPIYATGRNLNDEPAGATAKPEKAAKPAKKAAKQDDATIQDAGQKIGGARKDLWKERGLNTADLDQMTESEGATLAKKANVWKPDYEQIAKDADPVTAAMVKVVYDGLAAKPRQDTPQGRRDYVAAMQAVRAVYGSVRSVEQARDAFHALRVALGVERQEGTNFVPTKDQDAKRVMFSVYKGRSDPFVMQVTDLMRARDMVKAGFPDIAPWKRRFSVRPLTKGDGLSDRAAQLLTAEAEAANTPVTLEQLKAGAFAVVSKAGKRLGFASTQADAEAMAAAMYERTKRNDENEEPSRPHLDKLNRSGLPQRIDRDVTAEDFLSAFGWRGIEFGNWAAQDERQRLLNMAYDALMDLAQITNMPPKALSLNGTMGLAFGARGGGKFAAHYEPGKLVINMTKLRGAGSLAHEWAHALDHYLGELDRQDAYQGNARGASGWNDQARYTGEPQDRMVQRDGKWVATKEMRLPNLRPELAAAVDRLMKRLYETPIPRDEAIAIEQANIQRIEQYIDAEKDVKLRKAFVEQLQRSKQVLADLEAGKPSERTKRSSYATEAQRLSGKSEKGYWIRPTEMFARAFESYVFDRLKAMGAESDYLVHGVEQDRFADLTRYKGNPYPTADERTAINAAFDALVGTLKTRETETGGVAVYEPQRGYVPEAEAPRRRYSDDSRQLQLYLEGTETDPGQAGEGLDQARANAVDAVDGIADTQTILGLALSKDLAARQRVRLVGQKVASPEDLAVLAQVYRDPRFETFRVLFVDDANRVVSQLGITQRLPGATPAIVGDNMRNFLDGLQEAAERVGARGYYLLHNHPSGIAMPSSADVQVTRTYAGASQMPMLGHVVIDTNEFSVIDASGIVRTETRDFGQPAPFDSEAAYSGYQINGPAEVMALAKKLADDVDPNAVTLVTTNYQMQVLSVTTVPSAAITDDKAANRMLLTRSALKAKAARLFAIGRDEAALEKLHGIVLDGIHVSESGQVKSLVNAGVLPPSEVFPESRRARLSADTSPEFEYLRQQTLPNQLGIPNAERFRDMHRDIDAQFQGRSPTGVSPTELAQTDDGWVLSRKISRDRSVRVRVTPDHDAGAFIVAPTIYTSNLQSDMAVLQMVLEAATLARRRGYALRIKTGRAFGQQALMGLRKEFGGPFQFERPFLKLSADQLRMTDLAFLAFDAAIELRKERQAARQDAADYRPDVPAVFSRAPAGAPTGTPKAVQSVVDTIRARWANAPDIVVLADMQDPAVPAAVRNEDSRQRSMGATGEPEGFWYGGKAYLVASALPTSSDVVRALFHESLGHYGLRGAFGASLDGILDQLWVAQRARVTAKAAAYGYDTAKVAQRRLAAEEVLAEMAQSSPTLGFVRRAVAAIRTWLRETFPGLRMQLSDDEVIRSFILPARAFVESGRRAVGAAPVAARGQPVASLNDRDVEALVRQYAAVDGAPTEAAIRQAVRQFRDVGRAYGGRDAYRRALDAGRTRLTYGQWVQVRTPNFKAWFGNWEAVRAQSRLDAMPAVQIAIPAEWRDLDVAQLRARVRSALESMVESGEPLRHPEIGEVAVRQRGTKKALSASADPAKLLVLGDLRRAFEASIFANATVNTEGDANVVGFEKLLAKVDVAGVPLAAVFTVQRMRDGRQFYNSVTVEDGREKAPVASPRDTPAMRDGERATSAITGAGTFVRRALDRVNPDTVSKAIDAQTGEPKVMYHGTKADFAEFRATSGELGRGVYFSQSADTAAMFASRAAGEAQSVVPVYVQARNPLVTSDRNIPRAAGPSKLKRQGYDGVIFTSPTGDVQHLVFDPAQVKSATGNVGTFDPAAGDIRFSRMNEMFRPVDEATEDALQEYGLPVPSRDEAERAMANGHRVFVVHEMDESVREAMGVDALEGYTPDQMLVLRAEDDDTMATFSRSTLGPRPPQQPANRQQTPLQRLKARVMDLTSPESLDRLIYNLQNKFIDLKRIQDHITAIGGTVTDLNDAYLGEELFHKRLATRTEAFLKDEVKPLMRQLRATGTTIEELEQFLHARHAPEANRVLAERNPNQAMIDAKQAQLDADVRQLELDLQRATAAGTATKAIEQALEQARAARKEWVGVQAFQGTEEERLSLSGMSDQDAAAYQAALPAGKRQVLDALAARVDALQAKTLTTLERYGLMDRASLDAWRTTYQHYVPLHRDEAHPDSVSHPIGQGYSTKGDASRRRTGSNAKVTNILGHIVMQREAALTRGEKAVVGKKLYLLAAQNPDPNLWSVDKPPKITRLDRTTNTVVRVTDPMFKNLPNVVMVRIAGKDAAITFNERNPQAMRLAEALKNLDVGDVGRVLTLVGKGTRWFSSINTQYNPIFGLINFARDLQAGLLNLATTPLAGKQGKIAADAIPALRAIYRDVRGKGATDAPGAKLDFIDKLLAPLAPADSTWVKLWNQMQEDGGTTGYRDLFVDAADRASALQKELESLDRNQASKAAHAVVEWLSDYNETMENAIRLAAYKEALDMGMTRPRAASLAKNLTVNFNRKGRMGPQLGALYAFFNASLQGTARLAETLAGPTGRKIMLGGVMVGVVNTLLGMAVMGGGSGDDEEGWFGIKDFIRERSIIIPISRQDYVALPMPLGFHVLPNIGRLAVEMMLGGKEQSPGRKVGELMLMMAEAFNPVGSPQNVWQMISPTVGDPIVALMQNKDWTGSSIYRPDWNQLDPTPGPQRAKDSASTPARVLSQFLNFATGGTEYRPGAISWTPDQIDYVIGQLTGGLGRELLKVNQTITAPFTGDELPAYKIPLVGRLYGNTRGPANQSERFYENVREINEVENEVKGRARAGQDVQAVLREEPLAALIGAGAGAEKQITELRKIRRDVVRQAQPGYQAQVQQINEQIGGVMAALNKQVRTARETAAVQ